MTTCNEIDWYIEGEKAADGRRHSSPYGTCPAYSDETRALFEAGQADRLAEIEGWQNARLPLLNPDLVEA